MQGRVFTAFEFLAGGPQLLSVLAGAALLLTVDYRLLLVVMAAGDLLAAGYALVRLHDDPVTVATIDAVPVVEARG